ncbi:MAG: RsmB/NOP family class I SAM-dependent RNA methyltransferase [Deltaproteobacteria bacterium]|nr:RsmB/NOP family class I SAM-dependent RNA methyltransferase [Deltaproteobacteria bacterium]
MAILPDIFEQYSDFIPDFDSFQQSIKKPLPMHVRVNTLKATPEQVVSSLTQKGALLQKSLRDDETLYSIDDLASPGNTLEYFMGYIHPQALTSCLVSLALHPEPDSLVLDLCAAPGGKTSHLAQLMGNTGLIVANELYRNRHIPLGNTLTRLGIMNTVVTAYQAQEFPLKQQFDFVVADVPCSGEGRFRQVRADFTYRETKEKALLPELQKKILLRAYELLQPGGKMVYATCTYNPAENEAVVAHLLNERDAVLFPMNIDLAAEPGLSAWRGETYGKELERTLRFYPHRVDSVGFFLAGISRSC